jgi:radical SAM superfamily enzyme YgiQ (UPF0313 family)
VDLPQSGGYLYRELEVTMARIAVISCNDRCCMGARQLSSLVKNRHAFYLVCYGEYHHPTFTSTAAIGDEEDERLLLGLLKDLSPDLVGFSYRSVQAGLVTHLAGRIRSELSLPVIMGGIGATSEPDEAIKRSEIVCIGEADFVLPRLLDSMDEIGSLEEAVRQTPNLWHHTETGIVRNPLERLVSEKELSDFPFIDYEGDNKFTIVRKRLIQNDGRLDNDLGAYPMLTSRGCPFACTFCHNSNVHDLYCDQRYCRQRTVESVLLELEHAVNRFPTRMVSIYDDLFTLNREWALQFAAEFRKRIGLPFWCYTHPAKVTIEVHKALLAAGLNNTAMGVQSGSERTLYRVFNRRTSRAKITHAASVLKELNCRVQIDLITANPFETDDDRRDTLDLMQAMPKITRTDDPDRAWYYCQSRLTYFPNSRISQMAKEQGVDVEFDPDVASFWEMLHELAFMDHLPQGAVMYLSYLYGEYRGTAGDFKPETGGRWIRERLQDRPLTEISELFAEGGNGGVEAKLGWIPTPEELTFSEVRILMDGVHALRAGADDEETAKRVAGARDLLEKLAPEKRVLALKEALRSQASTIDRLACTVQMRAAEQGALQEEVDKRGKWALDLDRTVSERDALIRQLQSELDERTRWALAMDQELKQKKPLRWALGKLRRSERRK